MHAKHLAKHLHEVHFGGNWTWVNLKDTLIDIPWDDALFKIEDCNTIAALVFHINYYVKAITGVLEGHPLEAKDEFSFDLPEIASERDWEELLNTLWQDGEKLEHLILKLPEQKLSETFVLEKYGNYYRNLLGLIEHTHYHLGQIVILKKWIASLKNDA